MHGRFGAHTIVLTVCFSVRTSNLAMNPPPISRSAQPLRVIAGVRPPWDPTGEGRALSPRTRTRDADSSSAGFFGSSDSRAQPADLILRGAALHDEGGPRWAEPLGDLARHGRRPRRVDYLSLPFNPSRCSEDRLRPFVRSTGPWLRRTPRVDQRGPCGVSDARRRKTEANPLTGRPATSAWPVHPQAEGSYAARRL